jgi:hypothetical protein
MDQSGNELPDLMVFAENTVYQAEIRITAQDGCAFYPSTPFAYPESKIQFQRDDLGSPTRIIRVTYNNTNEADITFITDYNLQNYVPIPMTGDEPRPINREEVTVTAEWTKNGSAFTGAFEAAAVYQAAIQLEAKAGYRFRARFDYPAGTVTGQSGQDTHDTGRAFTVTYNKTRTPKVISILNLTPYIPKPAQGVMPVSSFTSPLYEGRVVWKTTGTPEALTGPFQAGGEYTAEVTLSPAIGYTFTGVGENAFAHTGAVTVTNDPDSGAVRISFPAASAGGTAVVYDTDLSGHIPRPISGETPAEGITGTQYTGTISWSPMPQGSFQYDTVYTAVLILSAAPGYTFTGIEQNAFTHGAASGNAVTNLANSGTVTITFPPAASATYTVIRSFGPAGNEDSALNLMNEKKDDNSLTIDLPGTPAEVAAPNGEALVAGDNSPAKVIIDGHGRVLRIQAQGTLLTVGRGVTLTLRNITLQGYDGNNAPLVTVLRGGKLILGEQAILTGNKSAGDAGGVWVNGGELVLNNGAVIKGMEARRGGGVLIDENGKLGMYGGTIGGGPGDGNGASGALGGGGVLAAEGSFDMTGGYLRWNYAVDGGGGVLVMEGSSFNMVDGYLQRNYAEAGGGGLYVQGGNFISIHGGIITENTGDTNNYDAYVSPGKTFTMTGGVRIGRVLLSPNATITIGGNLSAQDPTTVMMDSPPASGTRLLSGSSGLIQGNHGKFVYGDPVSGGIDDEGKYQPL